MVINRSAAAQKGAEIVAESSARRPKSTHQTSGSKNVSPRGDVDTLASQRGSLEASLARLMDDKALEESMFFVEQSILNQPSLALLSQANVEHSAVGSLLS